VVDDDDDVPQEVACSHDWIPSTCTSPRICSKCGEINGSANGHDWENATCTSPKTCKTCSATEGEALAHTYTVELVKDETLKSAATCTEAAVYYKSCACGAISTSAEDTFSSGSALEQKDENKDHTCDNACGKNDMLVMPARELHADLLKLGIAHIYVEGPGTHEDIFFYPHLRHGLSYIDLDRIPEMPNPFWIDG
jgi:hypothetical protein